MRRASNGFREGPVRPALLLILLLTWLGASASSAPADDVSLDALLVLDGEAPGDYYGQPACPSGDLNNDGFGDFIVGASYNGAAGQDAGRIYVYLGGAMLDGVADLTASGERAGDYFGGSVYGAGDVNRDGFDDFIAGAIYAGPLSAGRAYVYFGGQVLDSVPDWVLDGEAGNDRFGHNVAPAGDVNGDGYGDIVVTAYGYPSGEQLGRCYVFYGGDPPDSSPDIVCTGTQPHWNFGYAGAITAGDINADGFSDVVVGECHHYLQGPGAGTAFIYYGGPAADGTADLILSGEDFGDQFGVSFRSGGDLNADGYDDLLVGAPTNDAGGNNAGRVYLYYGGPDVDDVADFFLTGEVPGACFGTVAGGGDHNGDGHPDFLVGIPESNAGGAEAGEVRLYYGGPLLDATAEAVFVGEAADDGLGLYLEAASDLNGDQIDEFLPTSPNHDLARGRVYVLRVHSGPGRVFTVCPDGSGDFPTIQAAIDAAADGDYIRLANGVFTGGGNVGIDFRGKAITVKSDSGNPDSCVIDCEGGARGFYFHSAEGAGSLLQGLTVSRGHVSAGSGGGILCDGASPTIRNCTIRQCSTAQMYDPGPGGGIYLGNSSTLLTGCRVIDNGAGGSEFHTRGGGVACEGGSPTLVDCTISGNYVEGRGGGLYGSCGNLTIERCVISGNSAHAMGSATGGGISLGGTWTIVSCTIQGNWCSAVGSAAGGGVWCGSPGTVQGATITGNSVEYGYEADGGGIGSAAALTISGCTVSGNRAQRGGGIRSEGSLTMERTILWANDAELEGDELYGGSSTFLCCDVDSAGIVGACEWLSGNVFVDPLFCGPEAGDYHLMEDSPCAPENSPAGCGLIGALGVACPASGAPGSADLPAGLELSPSAPNPFRTATRIAYAIPQNLSGATVQIQIYDITGRLLEKLKEAPHPAGRYAVTWRGGDLEGTFVVSGVYFCRLRVGHEVLTRPIVAIR